MSRHWLARSTCARKLRGSRASTRSYASLVSGAPARDAPWIAPRRAGATRPMVLASRPSRPRPARIAQRSRARRRAVEMAGARGPSAARGLREHGPRGPVATANDLARRPGSARGTSHRAARMTASIRGVEQPRRFLPRCPRQIRTARFTQYHVVRRTKDAVTPPARIRRGGPRRRESLLRSRYRPRRNRVAGPEFAERDGRVTIREVAVELRCCGCQES